MFFFAHRRKSSSVIILFVYQTISSSKALTGTDIRVSRGENPSSDLTEQEQKHPTRNNSTLIIFISTFNTFNTTHGSIAHLSYVITFVSSGILMSLRRPFGKKKKNVQQNVPQSFEKAKNNVSVSSFTAATPYAYRNGITPTLKAFNHIQ